MVHDDSEDDLPEVIDATDSIRVGGASRRAEASRMDSQDPDDEEQVLSIISLHNFSRPLSLCRSLYSSVFFSSSPFTLL